MKKLFYLFLFTCVLIIIYVGSKSNHTSFYKNRYRQEEWCPNGTILFTTDSGNTGNKVWEYLSVFAVYKLFPEKQFVPYIPDSIIENLLNIFEPLSLPPISKLPSECQNFTEAKVILNSDRDDVIEKISNNTKVVKIDFDSSRFEDVIRYGFDKVREEFRYKPEYKKIAMDTLNELKNTFSIPNNENPVYVGMHFRGTDYVHHLQIFYKDTIKKPTHDYYSKAMNYFTEKYKNVIFVLISIDYDWLEANAKYLKGNVAVNPYKDSKAVDMAILSHCNHSIINYGTFGATVAMLAGGTTILYDLKVPLDYMGSTLAMGIAKFDNTWILMS